MSTIDFSEAELRRFAPKMADFYRRALLDGKAHLAEAGILDNGKRFSHFMGQVGHETGGGVIVRESLNYSTVKRIKEVWPARAANEVKKGKGEAFLKTLVRNPVALGDWAYGGRLGNRKGTSDGYDYRGGGFIQTTGRENVEAYCKKLGIQIRPDILDDPEATLRFACAEWIEARCNKLADANDLIGISKAINTGSATSSVIPNGMPDREAWFNKARGIWWDAEPADSSEPTETVPLSVKATAPPPTVAQNVASTVQKSRTIFRALVAAGGLLAYVYNESISIVLAAVTQFEALQPAAKLLTALGVSVAGVSLLLAFTSLGGVMLARVNDAATGKNVK